MTDTQHIHPEEISLYAMRLLSDQESEAVQAHLAQCSECREEFTAATNDLSIVALSVDLVTPAPETRERFVRQIAREKRVIAIDRGATASLPVGSPTAKKGSGSLLPWLGWAVAAGVTFAATSTYRERVRLEATVADQSSQLKSETAQMASMSVETAKAKAIMDALTSSDAMHVSLSATPAGKALPQGRATFQSDKGMLVFMADNLAPLPAGKIYELWLIPANGSPAIPVGTFAPDARGTANVVTSEMPKGLQAKAFGVTIEDQGGSATPTLPIILVGT